MLNNNLKNIHGYFLQNQIEQNEIENLSSLSLDSKTNILILIKSLTIMVNLNYNEFNTIEVKNKFIAELEKYGISCKLAISIIFIIFQKNNQNNYFYNIDDLENNILNHQYKNNISYIINKLEKNQGIPTQINLKNNIQSYITSIVKLCNNNEISCKLILKSLINHHLNNNYLDDHITLIKTIFDIYINEFSFDIEIFNSFLNMIDSSHFKTREDNKIEFINNLIFPYLNIELIDQSMLGKLLLDYLPSQKSYLLNFDNLKCLFNNFIKYYTNDNKKEIFITFIKINISLNYYDQYIFLLDILNEYASLINQNDELLNQNELKDIMNGLIKINLLKPNNFQDKPSKYFSKINNNNSAQDIMILEKLHKNIMLFKDKLNNNFPRLFNDLANCTIKKINIDYKYISFLQSFFKENKQFIDNITIKNYIYKLSEIQNNDIIDQDTSKSLLIEYDNDFTNQNDLKELYYNLIINCLDTNNTFNIYCVQELINDLFVKNEKIFNEIITDLIKDSNKNLNYSKVMLFSLVIINRYSNKINLNKEFIINIIRYVFTLKNISNNQFNEINNIITNLINHLKFKADFENNDEIVEIIKLGKNNFPIICIELFEKYIENDKRNELIKEIIFQLIQKQYDTANSLNILINYFNIFDNNELCSLVTLYINNNLSSINPNTRIIFLNETKYENILQAINNDNLKNILLESNRNFYNYVLGMLLENYKNDTITVQNIIANNMNNITSEQITSIYRSTGTIQVVNYIRDIQHNFLLNLPIRQDLLTSQFNALNNNAFHVHNYTNGVENSINTIIRYLVVNDNLSTINKDKLIEVINHYSNIEGEKKQAIINAINKISKDNFYSNKFYAVLPCLIEFLNNDNQSWNPEYKEKKSRWNIWLELGLLEAAQAYGADLSNDNNISCIKGIYERIFTPFRLLHPLFKLLFVNQDTDDSFTHNIQNELKNLSINVINKLKKLPIQISKENINNIFIDELITSFNEQIKVNITNILNTLNLDDNMKILLEIEFKRNENIKINFINKIKKQMPFYLQYLMIDDIDIYQHIQNKLKKDQA